MFAKIIGVIIASAIIWSIPEVSGLAAPFLIVALAVVLLYSYTKRFTRWSHLVLGLGLGIAPVGGYLAVTGAWAQPWWMLVALAVAVMTWTGGFDILYALQDIEFDRAHGLHSVPAKLGAHRALLVARVLHVGTVLHLAAVGYATGAGLLYGVGVVVAAGMLAFEHTLVSADDVTKVDQAFFTVNMALSSTLRTGTAASRVEKARIAWASGTGIPGLIAFALIYMIAAVLFLPGALLTLAAGAVFGLVAYATYDLTNLAVMKGFTLKIALIDMVWGMVLSAAVSGLTVKIVSLFQSSNA